MPERIHHRPNTDTHTPKIFIGAWNAVKMIPKKQELGLLSLYDRHIIPKLSKSQKEKADKLRPTIEKAAKAAGITLTVIETAIIVGGSVKLISIIKNKYKKVPEIKLPDAPVTKISPPAILIDPPIPNPIPSDAPSVIEERIAEATQPLKKTIARIKIIREEQKVLPTIRENLPETLPAATRLVPVHSTKGFTKHDASDFLATQTGRETLEYGNSQYDRTFSVGGQLQELFIAAKDNANPPSVVFLSNGMGLTGHAMRLAEGKFSNGDYRINRPFWHTDMGIMKPDHFHRTLEAGFSTLTPGLLTTSHFIADSESLAKEMDSYFCKALFPFGHIVHPVVTNNSTDFSNAGTALLRSLPNESALLSGGKTWWDLDPQFRQESLPIVAQLFDALADRAKTGRFPTVFVLSPEQGQGMQSQEAIHNALLMQSVYSMYFPLARSVRGMSSTEPFRLGLPSFATTPILDRAVRFIDPSEIPTLKRYQDQYRLITGTDLSSRADSILGLLRDINSHSWPNALTQWRQEIGKMLAK